MVLRPLPIIQAFDAHLSAAGLRFEAVVIGGTALVLLGIVERATRDCDVLAPELPEAIHQAAVEFAAKQRRAGIALDDDWLNTNAIPVAAHLPEGWADRVQSLFVGVALVLHTLGRADFLKTKLLALCDRGTDWRDCVALAPTPEELALKLWLLDQDASPVWPALVEETLSALKARLSAEAGHV